MRRTIARGFLCVAVAAIAGACGSDSETPVSTGTGGAVSNVMSGGASTGGSAGGAASGGTGNAATVGSGGTNTPTSAGGSATPASGGATVATMGGAGGTATVPAGGMAAQGGAPPVNPNPGTALPKHYHETNGWGTKTEGGLGGKVIKVTNLNNSGPGSLRAALSESGKRLVVFEVGGVIDLGGQKLTMGNGNLTVAGQTAPSPGITVIKADTAITGNDIVVSHMSFRLGDKAGEKDTMDISGENIVLDHVAASWSVDECVTLIGAKNVTMYKTMVTEALSVAVHKEGEHSKGSLIQRGTNTTSMIGTLYSHNALRNPRLHSNAQVALLNGVIYGWFPGADDEGAKRFDFIIHMNQAKMSIAGVVAIQGPESIGDTLVSGHKTGSGEAYMKENIIIDAMGNPLKEYASNVTPLETPPLWPEGYELQPNHESLYEVLRTVGPRPGDRDSVTARTVKQVADGTGMHIDSQDEVGGYPAYPETKHTVTVPEGAAAQRAWLDELEDAIAVDRNIDLSRLYPLVGSAASDKLR